MPLWNASTSTLSVGEDLSPYLKLPLDVRCLGMKLNHWNDISSELPTIYDSERFLFLLCTNFMSGLGLGLGFGLGFIFQ